MHCHTACNQCLNISKNNALNLEIIRDVQVQTMLISQVLLRIILTDSNFYAKCLLALLTTEDKLAVF